MLDNFSKVNEEGQRIDSLIREGRLSEERVAIAGGFFHPGARASSVPPILLTSDYRERIFIALKTLDDFSILCLGHQCLLRVIDTWKNFGEEDSRPLAAFQAVGRLVEQEDLTVDERSFRALSENASLAAAALEENFQEETLVPDVISAALVAQATSDLAFATAMSLRAESREHLIDYPAYAASLAIDGAAKSAPNLLHEMSIQVEMLCSLLLAVST